MNDDAFLMFHPRRESAYVSTRVWADWPSGLPFGYEAAGYDRHDPTTWAKAAAQQQVWRFDQGDEPEYCWGRARKFPSAQFETHWSAGLDDLCECDLALAGAWPK